MKHILFSLALLVLGVGAAQEEPYQVLGFPPFAPAPTMLEMVEDQGDTVVVRHGYGETEVPKNPQRIFAADTATLEMLLALELEPVGVVTYGELPTAVQGLAENVTAVPFTGGPNLEGILALEPDLIIGWDSLGRNAEPLLYEQMSRIAPTVSFFGGSSVFWQQGVIDLSKMLGIEAQGREVIDTYNREVAEFRDQIQQVVGDETFSLVRVSARQLSLYSAGYYEAGEFFTTNLTSVLYRDLRLRPGAEVTELAPDAGADISFEVVPELKADHLVIALDDNGEDYLAELTSLPLWSSVPAVQNGHVYVTSTTELGGAGYYSSLYRAELITEAITGESD